MKVSLILLCAGKGERVGQGKNKLLVDVCGQTCFEKTLSVFLKSGLIDEYVIAAADCDAEEIKRLAPYAKIAQGGETRTESVLNSLDSVSGDVVVIHDGARPFITADLIKRCIDDASKYGSAVAAVPVRDTIYSSEKDYIGKNDLFAIQTPQAFVAKDIKKAYQTIGNATYNDDGEVYKRAFGKLHITSGEQRNVKITFKNDMELLMPPGERFGTGFDCHKLAEGRKLILGGVTVPHEKGLLGHSDADVLAHAIMDAMLSAAALRDIGYYFPDTDDAYKDANSMELLATVVKLVKQEGYDVASVSAVIMAERPKLKNVIPQIIANLSRALNVDERNVGISATTLEGLGFVGREEGICVNAAVTLRRLPTC